MRLSKKASVKAFVTIALFSFRAHAEVAPPIAAAQKISATAEAEELTMAKAILKAMRNNATLYSRRLNQEIFEINYQNAWARMFLPTVTLSVGSASNYAMGQVPRSAAELAGTGNLDHGTPISAAQVGVGQYVIYNFGKDRDAYDSAKLEYERSLQSLHETERQVRFETIQAVFNLKTQQDLLDVAQRSVDAAQAVFDLVKSRRALGRSTDSDLASIEVDLLNAKNELLTAQTNYNQASWVLNNTLGDVIGHRYNVKTQLKYIKFKMAIDDIIKVYHLNSPAIREAKKAWEQAKLNQKIAQKNSLPLPTISFSGITIGSTFGPQGTTPIRDSTLNSGNIGISAALNFSIPLLGDGGFLNGRALRAAEVQSEIAEINLRNAANVGEVTIRTQYMSLTQTEGVIANNETIFKESLKVFESAIKGLNATGATNRLDFKDAIRQLRLSEQQLTQSILSHYSLKLQLAAAIGVDRFPEENL